MYNWIDNWGQQEGRECREAAEVLEKVKSDCHL
jgi:hypothetical protein